MRIQMNDGRVFEGTPLQIVEAMQCTAFGVDDLSVGDYLDWVVHQAERFEGKSLKIEGTSDEEKTASFVESMVAAGLAAKV